MTSITHEVDRERLLSLFRELLLINSPSGQEDELAARLLQELASAGAQVGRDEAGNVVARFSGEGEPLLLCAHMDTVEPTDGLVICEENGIWRSDGRTILGADDKAGVAAVLEAVRAASKRPPLEVVFTVREEVGLLGAKALDCAKLQARRGIVLDGGGPIGTFVVAAPSQYKLSARVRGRAAHAGVAPEEGVNAIVAAARAIARMPLGRIDSETTANVGVIRGGTATNIVPELVELEGEARSHSEEKLSAQVETMVSLFQAEALAMGAQCEVELERSYTRFAIPDTSPLLQRMVEAAESLGFEPRLVRGGGGSDANIFNAAGIECVNMSIGMAASHAKNEYIAVEDLYQGTRLLTRILEVLAR